jgi:hypothetical protein
MVFEDHFLTLLGPTRNANIHVAVQSRHADSSSEQGSMKGYTSIVVDIGTLPPEYFRSCNIHTHEEVASRTLAMVRRIAGIGNSDGHAVLNS